MTGTLSSREKTDQFLDKMDLERERGITIKAHRITSYNVCYTKLLRIAAEAADRVAFAYAIPEPAGHLAQKAVADVVPEGVVDGLEPRNNFV